MRVLNITTKPYIPFRNSLPNIKNEIEILEACRLGIQEEIKNSPKEERTHYTGFSDIRELNKDYEALNSILDKTSSINYSQDALIISKFIEQMSRLSKDKGFNKIAGYDDIKNYLYNEFVLKVMAKEKTSQGANVPNAFLFYGPTGCGKTLFAKALAQQTLSNVISVESSAGNSEEETFDTIIKYAQEAKENYENNDKKQRTIIILNEAEFLLYEDSPVLDKFREFLQNCAKDYKCTMFLTSNYPLDIDKSILSNEITPYKLYVREPNRDDAEKIIEKRLETLQRKPIDTQKLLDKLFENSNEIYSNAQIENIIDNAVLINKEPELNDYIRGIQVFGIIPSIKKDDIERYQEVREQLNSTN